MKKHAKKTKKLQIKKFLFLILFIFAILYMCSKAKSIKDINFLDNFHISIARSENADYAGIGQKKIANQDGYSTTFTTEENHQKTYFEYKQNGNSSWATHEYWGGTMLENGCGITTMAIILSGYNQHYTPEELRQKYYPVINYAKLSEELQTVYGIENSDFYYDSVHLSREKLEEHLKTNRPIIICVWNQPKKNRWTTSSHYMALLATDGKGKVYISNPNGLENTNKCSGWYSFEEVVPYIAKALYIETD